MADERVFVHDLRPAQPFDCPYCGAALVAAARTTTSARFTVADDETWTPEYLPLEDGPADYVDLTWFAWTCPNGHEGPALADLPGMTMADLTGGEQPPVLRGEVSP